VKKKRLITSALPYVNNIPHLGNIIGCVLSADVFARYCKMAGFETLYICGTDEYGTTTQTRALKEGLTPRELCDKYYAIHKEIYEWFNIDFFHFGRTSHEKQTGITQSIFLDLHKNGFIKEDTLTQPYCNHDEMFLADRFVEGICPHCGYDQAKGDQCESCGKLLNAVELKEPKCTICGNSPEFQETRHLFLDLVALKPRLEEWIDKASENGGWSSNALSITRGWLEQGLKQRCITRDLKWGIPVPLEGYEGKVFYVWFDAPIGYISITAQAMENWEDWWKDPESIDLYQFMGKDNIPFHTVLFPASLIGSGQNWTMLNTISSTEYLNYEDSKFSKSRGTGVFGDHVMQTGIEADLFRFYLLRNRPEKNDTQFFWTDFMEKANGEIIANYGNLVNRTLQFVQKFFENSVPAVNAAKVMELLGGMTGIESIKEQYEKVELKKVLLMILEICSKGNRYFQESEPWKLVKSDKPMAGEVIGTLCGFIRDASILFWPYIPATVEKVFGFFGLDTALINLDSIGNYDELSGKELAGVDILFKRLEKDFIEELRDKFSGTREVDLEPFNRIRLQVGKITSIEQHPDAERLYVEQVDMGNGETRQIVSGLVKYYEKEELLDKQIIVVANLKPAKLRGVLSEGMLLAAETKDRKTVEVISTEEPVGTVITIEGSTPGTDQVTIDDFAAVPLTVEDYVVKYSSLPLMANSEPLKVAKVEKGKVG
jgi:methionyl-tRNA synthetase